MSTKSFDGRRLLLSHNGMRALDRNTPIPTPNPTEHIRLGLCIAFARRDALLGLKITIADLAKASRIADTRTHRLLILTQLSPALINATLTGTPLVSIHLGELHRTAIDLRWSIQATAFRVLDCDRVATMS